MEELLYRRSGLKGVSGISADLRDLFASKDRAAARAIDLYCHLLTRHVGAMAGLSRMARQAAFSVPVSSAMSNQRRNRPGSGPVMVRAA